jgi:3-oxoacyl-[acyl-carrier protein] reductase
VSPIVSGERGSVVAITGAASGIGLATAELLADRGVSVALLDVDASALEDAASRLPGRNPTIPVDVADAKSVDSAFREIAERFGRLDGLVHAAGRAADPQLKASVAAHLESGTTPLEVTAHMTDCQWRELLAVNLDGTFYCIRAALRLMQPQGSGSIVTVSSTAAVEASVFAPHYAASKAGVKAFTGSVAKEVIAFGIRVNCIAPGAVDTAMWHRNPRALQQRFTPPIGRPAHAAEVAEVIEFLLSDKSSYLVGETVNVNGGIITT